VQKHRGIIVLLSLFVVVLGAGCPVYVQDPGGPQAVPVYGGAPATLAINNVSAEAVHYIHMSPSADTSWGPDLLGASTVLQVGQAFTIQNVAPGQWDVRIVDSSGNCKVFFNQTFTAGGAYSLDVGSDDWIVPGGSNCVGPY